jgi:aminoglycoside phosphotransferase (APT) family kinase protein
VLETGLKLLEPEPTKVAHGDLHMRHVLVDEAGTPTGVIDWGDVCLADPSVDLQLFWSWRAARVLALFLSAKLAVYGRVEGLANVEREAVQGLARAAID